MIGLALNIIAFIFLLSLGLVVAILLLTGVFSLPIFDSKAKFYREQNRKVLSRISKEEADRLLLEIKKYPQTPTSEIAKKLNIPLDLVHDLLSWKPNE